MTWYEWIVLITLFLATNLSSFVSGFNRGLALGEQGIQDIWRLLKEVRK